MKEFFKTFFKILFTFGIWYFTNKNKIKKQELKELDEEIKVKNSIKKESD